MFYFLFYTTNGRDIKEGECVSEGFLGGNKLITALAIDGICGEIEVLVG